MKGVGLTRDIEKEIFFGFHKAKNTIYIHIFHFQCGENTSCLKEINQTNHDTNIKKLNFCITVKKVASGVDTDSLENNQ